MSDTQLTTGIELISKERDEQFSKHHYTIENDVKYNDQNQMAIAASILLMNESDNDREGYLLWYTDNGPSGWDKEVWNKMLRKPYKERVAIAGAFCAAILDKIKFSEINEMKN